jgi:hypothetical protein
MAANRHLSTFGLSANQRQNFSRARPGPQPGYFMPRTKCLQSGAPTCSRLGDGNDAESRFKIGAPNPKVWNIRASPASIDKSKNPDGANAVRDDLSQSFSRSLIGEA